MLKAVENVALICHTRMAFDAFDDDGNVQLVSADS
jgi:hypothetical protein